MAYKKLWITLGVIMLTSFAVLGGVGYKAVSAGPPIPSKVTTADGQVLFTGETIRDGQNVWQSTGGQEIGTIWGHGAYVAPDWSADYLHRQSVIVLDDWAREQGAANYAALPVESRAALQGRLTELTRHNTYDPRTDTTDRALIRKTRVHQTGGAGTQTGHPVWGLVALRLRPSELRI